MSTSAPTSGARIPGGLTLERRIGEGALGEVWRARWDGHDEPVAVKLLSASASVSAEDDLHRRFAVEASAARSVEHPHAVRVLSHGKTEDGTPYVVMELLEGETLSSFINRHGMLEIEQVAQMIDEVGAALDAVHAAKLIHRDVKPHNVFVGQGPTFTLIDFGSAKHLDEMAASMVPGRRTDPDVVVGTPAYLSPEMVTEPSRVDHRADLWALGVTAYKCLTGQLPFAGDTLVEVCTNIMAGRLRRPTKVRPSLPRGLDLWFAYVFGGDIDTRPASGGAMARSFRDAIGDGDQTRIVRRPRLRARLRWPIAAAAVLPGVLVCAATLTWLARSPSAPPAAPAFPTVEVDTARAEPPSPAMEPETAAEAPAPAPLLAPEAIRSSLARVRSVVPAGPFTMGCLESDTECSDEEPRARIVEVDTFSIDPYEVSVLAYARCVHSGACSDDGLRGFQLGDAPFTVSPRCNWGYPQRLQHPLNCVSYEQVASYCRWVDARLPTEAEWEKAARGLEPRIYPWGDDPPSCRSAVMHAGRAGCRAEGTWPVGSKTAGVNAFGIYDMAGNVREWVDSWYDVTRRERRVLRGGGWQAEEKRFLRTSAREATPPETRALDLGFRCAVSGHDRR